MTHYHYASYFEIVFGRPKFSLSHPKFALFLPNLMLLFFPIWTTSSHLDLLHIIILISLLRKARHYKLHLSCHTLLTVVNFFRAFKEKCDEWTRSDSVNSPKNIIPTWFVSHLSFLGSHVHHWRIHRRGILVRLIAFL